MEKNNLKIRERVEIPIRNAHRIGKIYTFDGFKNNEEHFAVRFEVEEKDKQSPLVRLHSECVTGDVFGSLRCDCGPQLNEAIETLSNLGGYILYLRQEGRGIGFAAKMDAYKQQDLGFDTYEANTSLGYPEDARDFSPAAEMLKALGLKRIRLLTNNPDKVSQLKSYGIEVDSMVPTGVYVCHSNRKYLETKQSQHNHKIKLSKESIE
ncbi:GTP cyclohydrolase II RibA [Alteromonadaceae bacterium M269]|nr:GTP cyclohydrolase II RibA [Alteromonadaceae bacterium M269]